MKIYNRFLEEILLPIGDFFYGSSFIKELKKFRKIVKLPERELEGLQREKLLKLLIHASENVGHYKPYNKYKSSDPYEWIKKFPIVYKKDVKKDVNSFLWKPQIKNKLIRYASSGSSGIQGFNYIDKGEQSINRAIQVLWWEWGGYRIGDKVLQTGITPNRGVLKGIKDILFRTKYVSAFRLSETEILSILNKIRQSSDYVLAGFASSLYVLAEAAIRNNINDVKFKSAISWGDKLFPHYRTTVKEAFGTDTYETYGCGEGVMMAAQKDLDLMYIMSPHVYLEVVDEMGNEVPDGKMGYVLVTRLDAYQMPLIRYYLGDLAIKLPKEQYPVDRELQLPILQKVIGRDTDIVRTASGKSLIVEFFVGILEFYPEIKQFCVVQENLHEIEILYVPDNNFKEDILLKVTREIHGHLREEFPIKFTAQEKIEATPSGKPQIIISKIKSKVEA